MGLRLDVVPEELKEHEMEKDGFQMSVTSLNLRWGGDRGRTFNRTASWLKSERVIDFRRDMKD